MKKIVLAISIISMAFTMSCNSNTKSNSSSTDSLKTAESSESSVKNYCGIYKKGDNSVTVYTKADNLIYFYMDLTNGTNLGTAAGQLKLTDGKGTYITKEYCDKGCEINFTFTDNKLTLDSKSSSGCCGFGNSVYANGEYNKTSSEQPEFIINGEGDTLRFDNKDFLK